MAVIGYHLILAVVILELIFAFFVGLSCILLSYNLFRALRATDQHHNETMIPIAVVRDHSNLNHDEIHESHSHLNLNDTNDTSSSYVGDSTDQFSYSSMKSSDSELDFETMVGDPTVLGGDNSIAGAALRVFTTYLKFW